MRHLAPLLLTCLLACAHQGPAGPVSLYSDSVTEGEAELSLDLLYEPAGARQVTLILKMRVSGLSETQKLVGEVLMHGFNVERGSTRWDGFVPPRQPQTFEVTLGIPEDSDRASATLTLSRSHDSLVLLREELEFTVDAAGQVSAKRSAM
jgi:hypothetical protein